MNAIVREVSTKDIPYINDPRIERLARKGWREGTKGRLSEPGKRIPPEELKYARY